MMTFRLIDEKRAEFKRAHGCSAKEIRLNPTDAENLKMYFMTDTYPIPPEVVRANALRLMGGADYYADATVPMGELRIS